MNTKKGKLFIEIEENNQPTVVFHSIDNTVWMDRNELCELFGVYHPTLNTCLDKILKTKILCIDETCKYHRFVKNGRICFDITEVNLKIIIALAFHLESFNAGILREWFINRMQKSPLIDFPLEGECQYILN